MADIKIGWTPLNCHVEGALKRVIKVILKKDK